MKRFVALMFLFPFVSYAQQILTEEELVAAVKKFHPVAKAASVAVEAKKAGLLSSRGAFDPVIRWNHSQKNFEGIDYYNDNQTELKIPTWYGIDLYAGTENISGDKTNPEETKGKISYAGINIPLLQNLVLDKRRAALQTARLLINESEMQQRVILNDLIKEALHAYWDWWQYYHLLQLIDSSLTNAEKRYTLVKGAFLLGDRPAIDTIEALAQVQMISLQKNETQIQLLKSKIELSGFLWKENNEMYELPESVIPTSNPRPGLLLSELLQEGLSHPLLLAYKVKLNSLQIEKKLNFQSLLPQVDLKYQFLERGYQFPGNFAFSNNYRYGITFSMPLRFSEGRGEYRKTKLMIEETGLQMLNKQVQIRNKISQYYTEWQQMSNQLTMQEKIISNYGMLQKAEETRFSNGESTLFLINTREQKTLEAKQKFIALQAKSNQAYITAKWTAGIL